MRTCCVAAMLVCALACGAAANPIVDKVEPPDWWVGHTINPVRLLIHGKDLAGATLSTAGTTLATTVSGAGTFVSTSPSPISISNVQVSSSGTYLFVDLAISQDARPGNYRLILTNARGSTSVPFRVNPPLTNAGRLPGFTSSDVVYLIMPDRFANGDASNDDPAISKGMYDRTNPRAYHGGDFQGIIDHLPYLKELGVTAIWMTPVYDNSNTWGMYQGAKVTDYHGYGIVDYYGVDEHFGTMQSLQKLIRAAHAAGIKVIQDQVENHVGPHHPWVADPPTPTWFHGTTAHHIDENWQVWSIPDTHASKELRRIVLDGWFGNTLPDMDQEDAEVSRYQIQNTLWWLGEAGFDSIRQDTWPYVKRDFWHDWMAAIKRQFPSVNVIGEVLDGDPSLVSFFEGGQIRDGVDTLLDSLFDYPVYFNLVDTFGKGESIEKIPKMLGHDYMYPNPGLLWTFIGDHDMPRLMNLPQATIAGLKLAYTCIFTIRGVPLLYYGDEIAMKGGDDPDNRHDFPGGWPGDASNAFAQSGRMPEQNELFEHLKRLTHLRTTMPVLARGSTTNLVLQNQQWAFARQLDGQTVVIVMNNDTKPAMIEVPLDQLGVSPTAHAHGLLGIIPSTTANGYKLPVSLPARNAEVFVLAPQ